MLEVNQHDWDVRENFAHLAVNNFSARELSDGKFLIWSVRSHE